MEVAIKSIVLAVHLMAMGVASAGPLFCVLLGWRRSEMDTASLRAGHRLAWISALGLALGIGLGVVSLLLIHQRYWDVLQRIPERELWFALAELVFSLVCLLVYATLWRRLSKISWLANLIAFVSATNLLYHFPPLMIVLSQLASGSTHVNSDILDRSTLLDVFYRPEVIAPWLHFMLAAIAVSGGAALWLLAGSNGDEQEVKPPTNRTRLVAGIMLVVSLLQLPTGLWLLTTISNQSRSALMGSSPLAGLAFLAAMLMMYLLLGRLLKITLGEYEGRDLKIAVALLSTLVLLMSTSTRFSRDRDSGSSAKFNKLRTLGGATISTVSRSEQFLWKKTKRD